jgi:hypothetical protein
MEEQLESNIYTKFRHQMEETPAHPLNVVRENSEISWIKSVGECEAFIMASMFQHHVALSQARSLVLSKLSDAVFDDNTDLKKWADAYGYFNELICEHEDRMHELKAKSTEELV